MMRTRRTVGAAAVNMRTIHVPLDISNVVIAEQRIKLLLHMRECFWYCQIEHELIARKNGWIPGFAQHPLWVLAVHVAINIHHFGLDPNTELHAQ